MPLLFAHFLVGTPKRPRLLGPKRNQQPKNSRKAERNPGEKKHLCILFDEHHIFTSKDEFSNRDVFQTCHNLEGSFSAGWLAGRPDYPQKLKRYRRGTKRLMTEDTYDAELQECAPRGRCALGCIQADFCK